MKKLARPDLLAVLILLILPLIYLWEVLFTDKVLLPIDNLFYFQPWLSFAPHFGASIPHNNLIGDLIVQNYSWKLFASEMVRSGQIPLWNPYIFGGVPFLAAGQYGVLYPLGVLFYVLPVAKAYGWFIALHLFLGAAFMYAYMRVIAVRPIGALLSAITFSFSTFIIVSFVWPQVVSTAIWAPLLLLMVEMIIRDSETRGITAIVWVLLGAVALGFQFLAGHMEISFYILFTLLFYAVSRLLSDWWQRRRLLVMMRAALLLATMVALGSALASIQLIPFYEAIKQNVRAGLVTYQDVIGWALPKQQLLSFLMPDFFGNPTHHSYFDLIQWRTQLAPNNFLGQPTEPPHTIFWGIKNYVEAGSYVGILPLALAAVALLSRRRKYTVIFSLYAALALLLAFGSPLYSIFFYGIPGFSQLHSPFRWIFPYTISLSILAGLGADYLAQRMGSPRGRLLTWLSRGLLFAGSALLLALGASLLMEGQSLRLATWAIQHSERLQGAFADGQMLYSYQFRNIFIFTLLLGASGITFYAARNRWRLLLPLWQPLAILVLVLDLFSFGMGFNSKTDPRLLAFVPPAIEFLKSDRELYRLVSFGYDDVLKPNTAMSYSLQDSRGYDTIIPKQYVDYWSLMEEPHGLLYSMVHKLVQPSSLESPLLDLLNVKYVLTTQNIRLPHYSLVYRGEVNIYRNEDYLPRAFFVPAARIVASPAEALAEIRKAKFDPRIYAVLEAGPGEEPSVLTKSIAAIGNHPSQPETSAVRGTLTANAQVVSYEPNKVVVIVTAPVAGLLILTDSYFPGWQVTVDGLESRIYKADYNFRAVALEPGQHTVVFRYSPLSFKVGLLGSFLAFLTLLLGAGYLAWRWLYQEQQGMSTVQRIAKNSLTPMSTSLLNKVIDLAFAMFMLRILNPTAVGKYYFAIILIGYFEILTNFGLNTLLTREVAKDPASGNRYLNSTTIVRLLLCLVSAPLIFGLVLLWRIAFGLDLETIIVIGLLSLSLVPSNMATGLSSLFYAYEKLEYPAAVSVVTNLLKVALGVAALLAGWGIIGLAAVSVLINVITALVFVYLVQSIFFKPRLGFDGVLTRTALGESYPLMLNHLLATVFFRIDIMFLQPMRGDAEVGYYSTAYRFLNALNIIPSSFTFAIFPIISRYAESAKEALLRAYVLSLKVLLIVSLPITVGTAMLAPELILLLGGEQYLPYSAIALQLLITFLPLSYINSVTQYVLIAVNQQRFLTLSFLIGATFNIVANLLLIPPLGYVGASIVTVLSEVVLLVPFMYSVHRHVGEVSLLALAVRPTVAALLMGLFMWWLRALNPLLLVPWAGLVYFALLLLLRTFDAQDVLLLRRLLGKDRGTLAVEIR
ncbi:MAG: oligosaccharide flippase family protein [Chloroflexi bacterium]|nr:oligosaccharide flippase family protein [Chloroflexota bacterium]MCL5075248.1 oligosaccharide flippase family protein [Chloroflexota bacterium]